MKNLHFYEGVRCLEHGSLKKGHCVVTVVDETGEKYSLPAVSDMKDLDYTYEVGGVICHHLFEWGHCPKALAENLSASMLQDCMGFAAKDMSEEMIEAFACNVIREFDTYDWVISSKEIVDWIRKYLKDNDEEEIDVAHSLV